MNIPAILGVMAGWLLLQLVVLPALGGTADDDDEQAVRPPSSF